MATLRFSITTVKEISELIFPREKGDVSLVKSGQEKRIGMKIEEPIGKQWLKIVYFEKELIRLEKIEIRR